MRLLMASCDGVCMRCSRLLRRLYSHITVEMLKVFPSSNVFSIISRFDRERS